MVERLKYFDDNGDINTLYQKEFETNPLEDDDLELGNESNKNYELDEKRKKYLLNSIRNYNNVNSIINEKEKLKYNEFEKDSLPLTSDLIMISKNDKVNSQQKIINNKLINNMIFKNNPENNFYLKEIREQSHNENEYNTMMLLNEVNMRHPRKFNQTGKPYKFNICDSFGYFSFNSLSLYNKFSKFGEGLNDYFRLLKINFIFFIICGIFSFILFYCCGDDIDKYKNDIKIVFGYSYIRDFLTRYTLSNILMNNYYLYDIVSIKGKEINYTYSCPSSNNDNRKFQVYENSISKCYFYYDDEKIDKLKSELVQLINYLRYERVENEIEEIHWENLTGVRKSISCEKDYSSCTIDFSKYNKLIQPKYSIYDIEVMVIQYECFYNHNGKDSKKTKKIFISLNYIIIFLLIIHVFLLIIFHKYSYTIHNELNYQTNQYTIYIKNININQNKPQLYDDLNSIIKCLSNASFFQNEIPKDENDFNSPIYQICYPPFDYFILDLEIEKFDILKEYEIANYDFKNRKKKNYFSINKNNYDFVKLKRNVREYSKFDNLEKEIKTAKNFKSNININDIFITFKKRGNAEKCYNYYSKKNCFYRIFIYITCRNNQIKKFYYKNQWLDIEYIPPESDGLKYENLRYPIVPKFCIIFFSYLIIIIFICISLFFYFIGVIRVRNFNKTYKNYLNCYHINDEYNNDINSITYSTIYNEFKNSDKIHEKSFCLCKYFFLTKGKEFAKNFYLIIDDSGIYDDYSYNGNLYVYPCLDWINKMDEINKIYYIIYFITVILNIVYLKIIPYLVILERHKTIMDERVSVFIKTFICSLFINCLCPLLSNSFIDEKFKKKKKNFPIFTGEQISFNTEWYYYVSTTITINIICGIFIPYLIDFLKWFFISFIRGYCFKNLAFERNKSLFLYWFIGPEFRIEVRMGYQLSLFCTCLICGFFITNFIAIFSMAVLTFFSFYFDKILFIRYFKNPINYNQKINKAYIKILYFFIIVGILINGYYIGLIYLHVTDALSIKNQIIIMIQNPNIYFLLIIIGLIIFIPFIYYNIIPCFNCNLKYDKKGYEINEKLEQKYINDLTIYEVLPISILYKNYIIRRLEYNKISNYVEENNLIYLKKYYEECIENDQCAITKKINYLKGKDYKIEDIFDSKIKKIMDNIEDDFTKITCNYSYNISYFDYFSSLSISELIK